MVERVARALCRQFEIEDGFSPEQAERHADSPMRANFRAAARAAIAAMREPTVAMVKAADDAKQWFDGEGFSAMPCIVLDGWKHLVDAALEDTK